MKAIRAHPFHFSLLLSHFHFSISFQFSMLVFLSAAIFSIYFWLVIVFVCGVFIADIKVSSGCLRDLWSSSITLLILQAGDSRRSSSSTGWALRCKLQHHLYYRGFALDTKLRANCKGLVKPLVIRRPWLDFTAHIFWKKYKKNLVCADNLH